MVVVCTFLWGGCRGLICNSYSGSTWDVKGVVWRRTCRQSHSPFATRISRATPILNDEKVCNEYLVSSRLGRPGVAL